MSATKEKKVGLLPGREVVGPLLLLLVCPSFVICVWHTSYELNGQFGFLLKEFFDDGVISTIYRIWPSPWSARPWKVIFSYMAFELFLQKFVPGKEFRATTTIKGNVPVYTANGMQCYSLSLAALGLLGYGGLLQPGQLYDMMGELLSCMNVFALLFCFFLTIKGYIAPSSTDSGSNGSFILDYYWGTELYPRILGWDVKMFTNCRFGMMFWALSILCYAHKQYLDIGYISTSMLISVTLQLIYITKFFWWEAGYLCSMDIQHDRAGYYICWGCLVWLPCIYTSQTYYMVKHPTQVSFPLSIFLFGVFSIWANYDADRQRQSFRAADGKITIWGKPAKCIRAKYITTDGKERQSTLLASGWWGLARHFHYIPEITASIAWSVPVFTDFMPYFYAIYLTILLLDRAWRDDKRCQDKYGSFWSDYCNIVPYKVIPGLV